MSTSYLDLNGLGYLWGKAKDKFASKDISATDIEAVGISTVENEGNPVVISDVPYEQEADDVIVEFEPVQDLHGYDHPWPEGGGKNLAILEQGTINIITGEEEVSDTRVRTNFIPVQNGVTYVASSQNDGWDVRNGILYDSEKNRLSAGVYPSSGQHILTIDNPNAAYIRIVYSHINTSETCSPSDYWYQFEKGSTATSYAPYSNICPISGRTGVEVVRCGKNLCPISSLPVKAYWGYDEVSLKDALNVLSVGQYTISVTYKIETLPGNGIVTHNHPYITALVGGTQIGLTSYSVKTDTSPTIGKEYTETVSFIITDENRGKINHCYLYCDQKDGHTGIERGTYSISNIQLELGSTATPYEPYQGESYDIDFPAEAGTVYGGTLDVKTGELTVDRAMVDLGGVKWYKATGKSVSNVRFYSNSISSFAKPVLDNSTIPNMLCSSYEVSTADYGYNASVYPCCTIDTNNNISIYDNTYKDLNVSEFKSAMSGVQLVYELATPITYQLTPHQLTLLKKYNYIMSSDTNSNIIVTYDGKSDSTIQSELDELNETIFMIKQSISNSQIDNMFDTLDE